MNNTVLISALALSIAAGSTLSAGTKDHMRGHGHQMNFEQLDANADGKVTPEEMAMHAKARFDKADTNSDGALSEAELRAGMEARAAKRIEKRAAHMMKRHDANGDGQLSAEEMSAKHMGRMMKHADGDGDGTISKAEFDAMKDKHGKRHKGKHEKKDSDES